MDADVTKFLNHPQADLDGAEVVFLPLPYEGTVSYMKGTAGGPRAFFSASHQLEDYEEETGLEPTLELKIHTLPAIVPREGEKSSDYLERVEKAAMAGKGAFMVAVGGEHSVTAPVVRTRMSPGDTVIVIDAHPDLRMSYEGDVLSHASVMRRVIEGGFRVLQIGTGCNTAEEAAFVKGRSDFKRFSAVDCADPERFALLLNEISSLKGRAWLSIDLDGLCTSIMPGVGTPVPGGLGWHRLMAVLRAIFRNPALTVPGMDVVELMPLPESELSEFTAAKIVQKCLAFRMERKGR